MEKRFMFARRFFALVGLIILIFLIGLGVWEVSQAYAMPGPNAAFQASPIHPTFELLDHDGQNVLTSATPLSTQKTCGQCHDTEYIETHSFHADLGLKNYGLNNFPQDGNNPESVQWNAGNGLFGEFDPLTYRYLSQVGDERLDLSTPEWLMVFGSRIPGGGPAVLSREGQPLFSLEPDINNPETSMRSLETGEVEPWDWAKSGVLEMDCFLCHSTNPNSQARAAVIEEGKFGSANTATLIGTGIVTLQGETWQYNSDAFDETGKLKDEFVRIQDPSNENCAQCHGVVHSNTDAVLTLEACDLDQINTATTGQVIAPTRIKDSGLNLADKASLSREWDVHAERGLTCTDCHYSLNNPQHYQEAARSSPSHLNYDPRSLDIGEYLQRPDHNLASSENSQTTGVLGQPAAVQRCDSCHAAQETHASWLPYPERHMEAVACESCHIPRLYAPAIESYDWTVMKADGGAVSTCRGIEGNSAITSLVEGFQPALMQRSNAEGSTMLTPYNLVSTWFWIYDDPAGSPRPVAQADLAAAFFQSGSYAPDVAAVFDMDSSGQLTDDELRIDTPAKQELIAGRLEALGLKNPRIYGQVQPYSIHHNVTRGESVTRDCQACHSDQSLLAASIEISPYLPGGVKPEFVGDAGVSSSGTLHSENGVLFYQPAPEADGIYVFGHNRVKWVDTFGALAFVGVLLGVTGHGILRLWAARRRSRQDVQTREVYMYAAYERFWHWLQTFTIVLLLFTGLIIHRPDMFGMFSFQYVVTVHNVLAAVLVLNAALSLFWHLVSGEIRQFIPRPYGFFDNAIVQAKFYIEGIFKGRAHPFEKSRDKKLNPLQQMTYFGLLNVLLPLQIVTGALMWGVQKWPEIAGLLGGLPVLAPFHSLVAWLFAAFIVAHVYLTTTGATVFEDIKAMITGWERIEVHDGLEEGSISGD